MAAIAELRESPTDDHRPSSQPPPNAALVQADRFRRGCRQADRGSLRRQMHGHPDPDAQIALEVGICMTPEHLLATERGLVVAPAWARSASPIRPEPGFAVRVAQTACSLSARDGAAGTAATMASSMTGRWRGCGSPSRNWTRARCCGCISSACPQRPTRFEHLSRQARLHAGPIPARRCLQQLLLRRPRRLHEDPRGGSDEDHSWRRRQNADLAGSEPVMRIVFSPLTAAALVVVWNGGSWALWLSPTHPLAFISASGRACPGTRSDKPRRCSHGRT